MSNIQLDNSLKANSSEQPRREYIEKASDLAFSIGTIVALLLIWYLGSHWGLINPNYLPTPATISSDFMDILQNGYQGHPLSEHIGISLFRTLVGFIVGALFGVPLGLATGYSRRAGSMVSPIMAFIRPIPPIAFIPLAVLYFGLGELGKIVLIVFVSFNYVQANAEAGAANFPIAYQRAAQSLGLNAWRTFQVIVVPGALPQIFTGLKVALALSWAVVVAAELVGAQSGLGFMISDAALLFRIPVVFIGIALIGLIGLLMNLTLNWIEARVVHWKGR
jgi:NitT/TauT family transport system permease protein